MLEKNKFYNEQKQVKSMCYLFYKTFSKMTHLTETQRIEILILIGCWDKTKAGGILLSVNKLGDGNSNI
jgi:hypothetical protein